MSSEHTIIVTVDVVLFTLRDDKLHLVLMRRDKAPFQGELALPGGYVHAQEDPDSTSAARRVLKAKTGVDAPYLEQLYSFAGEDRDPRGWSVSLAHYALVSEAELNKSGLEAYELVDVDAIPALCFDHNRIVEVALRRLRDKSAYSALPTYLAGKHFTLAELQAVYEKVLGVELERTAFRRRMLELDIVQEMEGKSRGGKQRPAQLYRVRPSKRATLFDRTL